jgi:hypothetical protein
MNTEQPITSSTLCLIAGRYFEGDDPVKIAGEHGLNLRLVRHRVNQMEALLLLLAYDFPVHLVAKVMGIRPQEAHLYLDEIHEHIGDSNRVRDFVERTKLLERCATAHRERGSRGGATPLRPEAVEALEVLDFWASKWLP